MQPIMAIALMKYKPELFFALLLLLNKFGKSEQDKKRLVWFADAVKSVNLLTPLALMRNKLYTKT